MPLVKVLQSAHIGFDKAGAPIILGVGAVSEVSDEVFAGFKDSTPAVFELVNLTKAETADGAGESKPPGKGSKGAKSSETPTGAAES